MPETENYLNIRFSEKDRLKRNQLWKVLCSDFFQQFVGSNQTVLDMGAGCCEFINNITCGDKYALDAHGESLKYANHNVRVLNGTALQVSELLNSNKVDVVFLSNFLEHMRDKDELKMTLKAIYSILKVPGKLLILQPNIRYCYKRYWDFFDHNIPLSHESLKEVLLAANFKIKMVKPRFLPFSTKSFLPLTPVLVKIYLKLPLAQLAMGKQMFICAANQS